MGDFLKPIGDVFHVLFYLPVYNVLMVIYEALNNIFPAGAFAIAIVILTLIIRAALKRQNTLLSARANKRQVKKQRVEQMAYT